MREYVFLWSKRVCRRLTISCNPKKKSGNRAGVLLYRWLQQLTTYVETESEFVRSSQDLLHFLRRSSTRSELSVKCINAVKKMLRSIRASESKLSNHHRMQIRHSNEACTTSPVESQNSAIKGGVRKVHSNMNLDRSTRKMVDSINTRLTRRRHYANRQVGKSDNSSLAPTKAYVIKEVQRQVDRQFDNRKVLKSAQLSPTTWAVWDFDSWVGEYDLSEINEEVCLYTNVVVRCRSS